MGYKAGPRNKISTSKEKKGENITDFIIRAESATTALKAPNENVRDALLVAMVLKGLPEEYTPFIAVVTQSEEHQNFQRFKGALQNYKETKKTRKVVKTDDKKDAILKTQGGNFKGKQKKDIKCYTCGKKSHKSLECYRNASSKVGAVSVTQLHMQIKRVINQMIAQSRHSISKMRIQIKGTVMQIIQ